MIWNKEIMQNRKQMNKASLFQFLVMAICSIWTVSSEFGSYRLCEQRRFRRASPEPLLLAHISSESRGPFRQKARSLASLNGWAWAVKTCRDWMLEDTNSLDGAHIIVLLTKRHLKHKKELVLSLVNKRQCIVRKINCSENFVWWVWRVWKWHHDRLYLLNFFVI